MSLIIRVVRQRDDLHEMAWLFFVDARSDGIRLILSSVTDSVRPSRRHKWRIERAWYRLAHQQSRDIKVHMEPTVPDDVAAEARLLLVEKAAQAKIATTL